MSVCAQKASLSMRRNNQIPHEEKQLIFSDGVAAVTWGMWWRWCRQEWIHRLRKSLERQSTFAFSSSHLDVLCMKSTDSSDGGGSRCQYTSAESTK